MILTVLIVSLVSLPCVAHATGIYQTHYSYSFEAVSCAPRLAFVICDDSCTAGSSLLRAPKAVTLFARVSQQVSTEESLPGTTVSTGIHAKVEIPKDPAHDEKSELIPTRQGAALKKTSVLFALDSFMIEGSQKAKLSAFVAEAKNRKDALVSVEGYTCDLGSQTHNDALARKRAETVAAYLEKADVHPASITGKGRCCYLTEESDKRSLNRRVEITVSTGENR